MHPMPWIPNLKFTKDAAFMESLKKAIAEEEDQWEKMIEKQTDEDKFRPSKMSATSIKIGSWERKASLDVKLVAKFYFARKNIIWEIFEENLLRKIEMDWDDVLAIKATFLEGQPDTLAIELNNPPKYRVEVNRQPMRHTDWKACDDFTSGQATMHRRHFLTFEEGTLFRDYRKLVMSDHRLFSISQGSFPSSKSEFFQNDPREFYIPPYDLRPNNLHLSNQPYRVTNTPHVSMQNQTIGPTTHSPYPPFPPLSIHMNRGSFNSQPHGDYLHSMNSNGAMISGLHDNFPVWIRGVTNNECAFSARGCQNHGENSMTPFTTSDPIVTTRQLGLAKINSTCLPMLNQQQEPCYYPFLPANANSIASVTNSSMAMRRGNQTMIPHRIPQENFYPIAEGRIEDRLPSNVCSIVSMPNSEYNLVEPTRSMAMGGYNQNMIPEHTVPQESVYLTADDQIQGPYSMYAGFDTSINGGHYPYNQNSTTQEMLLPELKVLDNNEHKLGAPDLSMGAEQDQ